MSFIKNFKAFLEKINIDYDDYANCMLTDRYGKSYPFSQMNKKRILNFDWAYFLAEKNQIILLNNNQDTLESLQAINNFQGGRLGAQDKYYQDAIKENDSELFEQTRDMYCFIRYLFSGVMQGNLKYMYLEDGSMDNFWICLATAPHTDALAAEYTKDVMKAAKKVGLYLFPVTGFFPKIQIHSLDNIEPRYHKNCFINGIHTKKNYYNENRNAELIDELNAKRRETRLKKLNFVMSKEDDIKYTEKAKKLYDEIKTYGLEYLEQQNPKLKIENFLTEVFKVLLYKKWATYQDIVTLEGDTLLFFHMYESETEIPSKENLIFDIIDYIKDYVQTE